MSRFIDIIIISSFLFAACKNPDATAVTEAAEHEHEEAHESSNTASLTEEQMQAVGITLGGVEQKQLTASLKTNGILKVPNQNRASVNSIYSGTIKSLLVQPGNSIKKGQVIATVANPEFIQAQSQYLNVITKLSLAELELTRQKELNAGNAGALKNLQAAGTELKTLQTLKSTLQQQLHLMGINSATVTNGKLVSVLSITSPINGVVSEVPVKMGSYVDLSTPVAEIVDNSQLHLDLFVYEKDLPELEDDQLIHFTLTNNPGKEYDAQIFSLGSSFEGDSKAVTVHAKVQGDKTGLIDGMNITAVISLDKQTVPAVPTEAIVTVAGQDFIFISTPGKKVETPAGKNMDDLKQHNEQKTATGKISEYTFEKIPVARGTSDVGYTEITLFTPLPENAQIVVKGAFFVLAKMTNTGGHEH